MKPGAAEWKASLLPLCLAAPPPGPRPSGNIITNFCLPNNEIAKLYVFLIAEGKITQQSFSYPQFFPFLSWCLSDQILSTCLPTSDFT